MNFAPKRAARAFPYPLLSHSISIFFSLSFPLSLSPTVNADDSKGLRMAFAYIRQPPD